ncbi:FMN-binding protein, partial [Anaerotignum faecicola]
NMGQHDGAYRDGTYYEEIQLGEETAEVAVTIAEGRIAEVSMEEETEAVAVFYPLLAEVTETVGQAVIENQSAEIAVENENPHSAQAILDAVAACLEQAER